MATREYRGISIDDERDSLLTEFGKATLADRYLYDGESYQELFARVAISFSDNPDHAQRLYDYMSRLWFMPATPVLSNGGTTRGLPISCLTGDQFVHTKRGLKQIKDIEVGDMVLTHKGRWRPVVAKASRESGDLYELVVTGRATKIKITGNHPVLTDKGWVRVDALSPYRKTRNPNGHRVATHGTLLIDKAEYRFINLGEHCPYTHEIRNDHVVAVSERKIIENGTATLDQLLNYAAPRASVAVDSHMAWALGLWFAEGSLSTDAEGVPNGIRITMGNTDEEKECAYKWLNIMKSAFSLNGNLYESKTERNGNVNSWTSVNLNSTAIGAYFAAEFGINCKVKEVPEWLYEMPVDYLEEFLRGFIAGDGCEHITGGHEYCTITIANPALLGSLYHMALLCGWDVSLKTDTKPGKLSTADRIQTLMIFTNGRKRNRGLQDGILEYQTIRSLTKLTGSHQVYDIQIEEDESFTVSGVVVHNCFLNEASDSMHGIRDLYVENMSLASAGGGIGSYWGNLRSNGEAVGKAGKTSGVIPFMKVMDSQTLAVSQGSLRRGSAAVYLRIDHPEIEEFLQMRKPTGGDPSRKCLNLHHGIGIPNSFMEAVRDDLPWALRSPKTDEVIRMVGARELWSRILELRMETGEPYLIWLDTVNSALAEWHQIAGRLVKTSNLCTEIFIPTSDKRTAVCCLSSLNLELYSEWRGNRQFVIDVMRFLDNVLENFIKQVETNPRYVDIHRAAFSAKMDRSVGLGVMGFHSFLQRINIPFESEQAKFWNKQIFGFIKSCADEASKILAKEKGACPDAAKYGFMERFSNKTSVAPTASISIICGGASPGIEPIAANIFTQKTLSGSHPVKNPYLEKVLIEYGRNDEATWNSITTRGGSVQHLDFLTQKQKDVFKTSFELDQMWIIRHAADRTPLIDQGSSTNLFFPAKVDKAELLRVHYEAWRLGLKSLYYCRSLALEQADAVGQKVKRERIIEEVNPNKGAICEACE